MWLLSIVPYRLAGIAAAQGRIRPHSTFNGTRTVVPFSPISISASPCEISQILCQIPVLFARRCGIRLTCG
ncbi:hypothetical protein BDW74DRAFT_155249 [Aspergillus multicolor]|uniref:uncharacterized protein n=1 Tax=Aspergillus multicolor TaxID=41759 RepID=UPI003CCD870B